MCSVHKRGNAHGHVLFACHAGGLVDLVFQLLVDWLEGFCLLVFAGVAVGSGIYVWAYLPETKGKSLSTVQVRDRKP